MNRTQFFTDAIAAQLADAIRLANIPLPVVGQISSPEPLGRILEVRVESIEETAPTGNHTFRLDCQIVLHGLSAAQDAERTEHILARAGKVCRDVLCQRWRYRALPHPAPGTDPEYDACPFIVLELIMTAENPEANDTAFEGVLGFRAYVQF